MNDEQIKQNILAFIKAHTLMVISTIDINTNKPESAVIGCAETDNLELVFGTSNTSRKYKNLQIHKQAAFVIGWSFDKGTVQYEGDVREVGEAEISKYRSIMAAKNPQAQKFLERPDQRFFLVTPTWIRFTDKSKKPDEISEVTFTNNK